MRVLAYLFLMGLPVMSCHAQVLYGTLTGTVEDASGGVVPAATVKVANPATGQKRETATNSSGSYTLTNLTPGAYSLEVSAPGFQGYQRDNIEIGINTVSRADVQLQLGEVTSRVNVDAGATVLQTDKADVHVELGTNEITQLPVGGYRNYQTLINLVPGATPAGFQNSVLGSPGRALSTNVNGTARNNNNTRLDGAYNMRAHLPHQSLYVPPIESIEVVNISTNSFDAEQGFAGGAAINVVTKSGTNQLHGVFFEHFGNSALNAKNFFYLEEKKPKYLYNTYGGAIGGPIVRNRLFFFGSWEGMRERSTFSRLATLATPDQRAGDFSAYRTNIYDPATGDADGRDRTLFPNATIPLNRQSAVTRKLQGLAPPANLSGTANNFFASSPTVFDRDNYDAKINYNLSSKTTLWGKVSVMDAQVTSQYNLGPAGGQGMINGGGAGTGKVLGRVITFAGTHLLTPSLLIDGNLSFSHDPLDLVHTDSGSNLGLEFLGIPGTNGPDVRQSGLPIFNISGYENYGNPYAYMPKYVDDNSITVATNVGWQKGVHDIRFGFDMTRANLNHFHPEVGGNGPRGRFDFTGGITALNGGPAAPNQFNTYAGFLLGLPQIIGKSVQVVDPSDPRERQYALYFRDRWQATRKLTLTLGLRWEYFPLTTRGQYRGIERYDFDTDKVLVGGYGNVPNNAGITTSKRLFAPRVGIAYRMGSAGVLRAGYGISYEPYPLSASFLFPYPVMVSQDFIGTNTFVPYSQIERGIPTIEIPDLTTGVVALPLTATTQTLRAGNFSRGYIQSFNLTVERQLAWGFVGSAGYVGTRTIRQMSSINVNAAEPGGGQAGRPLSARFGRRVDLSVIQPFQTGNYDSLQARLDRRFERGLSTKIAYTFGKAINWTDDSAGSLFFNAPSALARNRALANYDRTHNFRWAWVYEMPARFGSNMLTRAALSGWQLNGIFSAYSGTPFSVTAANTSLNAPGNNQTADQVQPEVQKLGGIGRNTPFFDPSAFAPVTAIRFGSSGRNILRGPGFVNADLGLFRNFALSERWRMQFRAEAFNFTNTPKFSNPAANVSAGGFMTVTSALSTSGSVEGGERAIRFALRFSF